MPKVSISKILNKSFGIEKNISRAMWIFFKNLVKSSEIKEKKIMQKSDKKWIGSELFREPKCAENIIFKCLRFVLWAQIWHPWNYKWTNSEQWVNTTHCGNRTSLARSSGSELPFCWWEFACDLPAARTHCFS